jgi:hypothetical protein
MPCRMVVEGHIATVHVTLVDVEASYTRTGTAPAAPAPPPRVPTDFPEIFSPGEAPGERDPEEMRADLEAELTDEARRLLESDDVSVELKWKRGSLEIGAILVAGKIVADVGSFLGGVRAIRDLFPGRIRERVAGWLGRDVAAAGAHVEAGTGLLRGQAEEKSTGAGGAADGEFTVQELGWYAVLSLIVLLVVAGAVILGLELLLS